jgi:hypothetical protein
VSLSFVTSEGVVYKTRPPACCPSCGVNKREKHCMLPLVTDVVLSQSWLEAKWGIWSVKIENAGQGGAQGQHGGGVRGRAGGVGGGGVMLVVFLMIFFANSLCQLA